MRSPLLSIVAVFLPLAVLGEASDVNDQRLSIAIAGIEAQYPSCAVVTPTIRNNSKDRLYFEVYVEEMRDDARWSDVECQYDLADPRSEHIKRILTNPRMTDPGDSLTVKYDRCAAHVRCRARKSNQVMAERLRQELIRANGDAHPPVTQRFRVDVYEMADGHVRRIGQEYSRTLTRSGQQ